ncbi:alpha/beta fold hydrolase [Spirochaeta dissipatitropha]
MSRSTDFRIISGVDGAALQAYRFDADSPCAVVIMVHGLAEHGVRYTELADYLSRRRIASIAYDHRGHGKSLTASPGIGSFAPKNGWNVLLGDLQSVSDFVKKDFPDIPVFLLGHSMGSFLVRTHLALQKSRYSGVIISGTASDPGIAGRAGLLLARILCLMGASLKPSPLLNSLSFGAFNKAFAPAESDFDWLSRDSEEVAKYIHDNMCGFVPTAGLFRDMLAGLIESNSKRIITQTETDLPKLFFSGGSDPVGRAGKGFYRVLKVYRKCGHDLINAKLYPDGRHEMLHEVNRTEVYEDVVSWMLEHISAGKQQG